MTRIRGENAGVTRTLRAISFVGLGTFFMGTGLFKLLERLHPSVPRGPAGFARFLAAAGVPAPRIAAPVVCALEISCGLALIWVAGQPGRRRAAIQAIAGALLVVDMLGALATAGLPGLFGRPVTVDGVALAREVWRVPLELGLLAIAAGAVVVGWRGARGEPTG